MRGHTSTSIELINGGLWDFSNAGQQFDMTIEELAEALSNVNRYTGHTCGGPYNVAQHSCIVSWLLDADPCLAMYGLLHDGHECIINDISTPFKTYLRNAGCYDAVEAAERRADGAIFSAFGLAYPMRPEVAAAVKRADLIALATEKRDMRPNSKHAWTILNGVPTIPHVITPITAAEAAYCFVERYREIASRLNGALVA